MITERKADNVLEKLIEAIKNFSDYQKEIDKALTNDPIRAIRELGTWNNEHQKKAASVQFFIEEFIKGLNDGDFTPDEGDRMANEVGRLKEQETLLFEKLSRIRDRMVEERKRLESGQKALNQYAVSATVREFNTAFLSRDA